MKPFTAALAIVLTAGAGGSPVWAQNYPPPQQQPQQPQYPQQQPYPQQQQQQYPQQPPPYYGQQQQYPQQPPSFAPQQLDALTGRIALYPDPLLAQVLTAATYSNQIPDAAGWARAHSYVTGDALAHDIQDDGLPWDPSVIALLPFPSVLDTMSGDMGWTQQLGNAVLADRGAVMDAVQRQRALAANYGYLRSNSQYRVVNAPGDIEILPADPAAVYVPYYDPYLVYSRPRPGFFVGGAISFGPRIVIGASFAPWGWGHSAFGWREHRIVINNRPWDRRWDNRQAYVHPYTAPRPRLQDRRVERHELHEYRAPERHDNRRDDRRDDKRDDKRDRR